MRVAVHNHLGEANALGRALMDAGHTLTLESPVDLCLISLDPVLYDFRSFVDHYRRAGAITLIYPHGAPSSAICYDSLFEPYAAVDGQLTHAGGEIELLRRLGVVRPARAIGWPYCPLLSFRACKTPHRVLFAPTHPNGDGSMRTDQKRRNAAVFTRLLTESWDLTVRFLTGLEESGIWESPGVRYVRGEMDLSYSEIDEADLVVAGMGTFPSLAVARGVPTVVYGQAHAAYGYEDEPIVPLRSWYLYKDLLRYPYDALDVSLTDVVAKACQTEATEWRRNWIGDEFDPERAVAIVEEFVRERQSCSIPS